MIKTKFNLNDMVWVAGVEYGTERCGVCKSRTGKRLIKPVAREVKIIGITINIGDTNSSSGVVYTTMKPYNSYREEELYFSEESALKAAQERWGKFAK